ncbi:NADP(+)-dependent dehydrogenase [Penicillium capsulatum]|uniref:NADP(+)-dependent dehydrogenase n=1 Tax=Penicillium capsulatum TaxID=69766 RepID=A0A9W9INF6_9EURO|nr:NADP(+)-dependent dehydrogenase [Penicillium capsulatum]KAJ6122087.1 NADP(+)-dependent dehydrogenase [Penicillium capsulatum]
MSDLLDLVRVNNAPAVNEFVANHHDTYPFIAPTGTELTGKSIFISGASSGVGRATAIQCVRAGCAKIAIAARSGLDDVVKEMEDGACQSKLETPHILPLQMDVTSEDSVRKAAKTVAEQFQGKLDILVNNAGYLPEFKPISESDPLEWWKGWEVNIKGIFLCCHFFLPLLLNSESKIVINVSSIGAHTLTYGASSYQGSKFATCRLTEFLTRDYEQQNLIAISIHPGGVKTGMIRNFPEAMHATLVDTPSLPADSIIWLVKERREWLNGRYVHINWDMRELEKRKDEIVDRNLFKFRMTA